MHKAHSVEGACLRIARAPGRQFGCPFPGAHHLLRAAAGRDDVAVYDRADQRRQSTVARQQHGLVDRHQALGDPAEPEQDAALQASCQRDQVGPVRPLPGRDGPVCDVERRLERTLERCIWICGSKGSPAARNPAVSSRRGSAARCSQPAPRLTSPIIVERRPIQNAARAASTSSSRAAKCSCSRSSAASIGSSRPAIAAAQASASRSSGARASRNPPAGRGLSRLPTRRTRVGIPGPFPQSMVCGFHCSTISPSACFLQSGRLPRRWTGYPAAWRSSVELAERRGASDQLRAIPANCDPGAGVRAVKWAHLNQYAPRKAIAKKMAESGSFDPAHDIAGKLDEAGTGGRDSESCLHGPPARSGGSSDFAIC